MQHLGEGALLILTVTGAVHPVVLLAPRIEQVSTFYFNEMFFPSTE